MVRKLTSEMRFGKVAAGGCFAWAVTAGRSTALGMTDYESMIALQHLSGPIQRGGKGRNLLLGASEIMLVDGLVNSWDDHGRVSGVLAGSINGVAKPRTIRKSFRY
jgi:hypothetical protein